MGSAPDPKTPKRPPIAPELLKAALELWGQAGEIHLIPITGISMLPLLREGDIGLVAHTREVQPGEIAVFQQSSGLVAHRVLASFNHGDEYVLRTKGDNTLGLDPPVHASEIVGKAIVMRRGGRQMRLDSRAWQRVGRAAAVWSKAQARVYYRGSTLSPTNQLNSPSPLSTWASRVLRLSLYVFLRVCYIFLARWREA